MWPKTIQKRNGDKTYPYRTLAWTWIGSLKQFLRKSQHFSIRYKRYCDQKGCIFQAVVAKRVAL